MAAFILLFSLANMGMIAAQHCVQQISLSNPDFEEGANFGITTFRYVGDEFQLDGWNTNGRVIQVGSQAGAWRVQFANIDNALPDGFVVALQLVANRDANCPGCRVEDRDIAGSISQTVFGLEPGSTYQLGFAAAERAGYGDNELFSVFVDGQAVVSGVNARGYYLWHTATFTAQGRTAIINISNTSPLRFDTFEGTVNHDHTIFVDNITLCKMSSTTTSTTTSTTGSRTTVTTHTAIQDNDRDIAELRGSLSALVAAQSSMAAQISIMATSSAVESLEARLNDRLTAVESVIRRAAAMMPQSNVGSCTGADCTTSVESNGDDIRVKAPRGDVFIETSSCGTVNPCDIMDALAEFRTL